jgi:hypothetical protein
LPFLSLFDDSEGNFWWTWSGSNRRPLPCHGAENGKLRSLVCDIPLDRQNSGERQLDQAGDFPQPQSPRAGLADAKGLTGWNSRQNRAKSALFATNLPVAVSAVEQGLGLYRERYFDQNVRHFHEKLREHGIQLSYTAAPG